MAAFNWFQRSYEEPEKPKEEEEKPEAEKTEAAPASPEDYLKWAKAAYQNIQERQGKEEGDLPVEEGGDLPPEGLRHRAAETPEPNEDLASNDVEPAEPAAPAEEAVDAPEEAVEATEEAIPTAEDFAEATEEAVAITEEAVATTEEAVDATAQVVGTTAEAVATTEEVAAATEEAVATTEEAAETTSAEEIQPASSPAQPFWAQAQTEREERLARLQAEAILEPEPEPEPAPPELQFVPLDIDLDEAFLWSAEVLASQGRRPDQISLEEITWLNKLRQGLDKTRRGLVNQLKSIVGQGPLNDEAIEEIESLLLQADVGVKATDKIIGSLQARLKEEALPPDQAISYLKSLLRDMLDAPLEGGHNLTFTPEKGKLSVWLMTGVNGAGKTTTIGKLTHIATKSGFECLIGAADTFRAAAVEQVKVWGARSGVEVIANPGQNTDPASVVFDAISAAKSRGTELLLIDTAGRLQNKKNLMDELAKVRKIIDKKAPDANVESLLVLDATLGQNGLRQAQVFAEAAQLSGVVLTKLDGTARGGVALAVVQELNLPIRFIGAGEGIEDLRPFSSYEFVEALLNG